MTAVSDEYDLENLWVVYSGNDFPVKTQGRVFNICLKEIYIDEY